MSCFSSAANAGMLPDSITAAAATAAILLILCFIRSAPLVFCHIANTNTMPPCICLCIVYNSDTGYFSLSEKIFLKKQDSRNRPAFMAI
jgi:hypothetical protein